MTCWHDAVYIIFQKMLNTHFFNGAGTYTTHGPPSFGDATQSMVVVCAKGRNLHNSMPYLKQGCKKYFITMTV